MKSHPLVRLSWLLAVLAVAACNQSPPAPSETVTPQFGTSSNDTGVDVTFDSSGRIYIAGSSYTEDGSVYVRRYARSGGLVWKRQFGDAYEGVTAAGASGDGGVYVMGYTYGELQPGGDFSGGGAAFIRKYSSSGTVSWTRQFVFGDDYSTNHLSGVAGDRSGNIYVVGRFDNSGNGVDNAFVRKYSSNGAALWTRTFAGSTANDAVVDQNGYLYVVGESGGDAFFRKYSATGTLIWTRLFGGTNYGASAVDVYRDAVYVAGELDSNDAFVRKYSTSGTLVWTRAFGTTENDSASDVEVDSLGNVYVAGTTGGSLAGSKGGRDAFVRKYSASGSTVRTKQFGSPEDDWANAVTTRTGSEIYVAGSTDGALAGSNQGYEDAFLRRLNASGDTVWTR